MYASTRRRLRLLAWLGFLVLAPLLLAYARGYRLPKGPLGTWIVSPRPAVGALVVRTVPRGAAVRVDGAVVDEQTPTGMGSLPAGVHEIRIEKPGYRPFEKRLSIEGGRVTDLLSVRLIPEHASEEVVLADAREAWVSPDERLLLVRDARGLRVRARDAENSAPSPLLTPLTANTGPLALDWSSDGTAAVVSRRAPDVSPRILGIADVSAPRWVPLPLAAESVGWTRVGPPRAVFLLTDGTLQAYSLRTRQTETLARAVGAAAIHPRGIVTAPASPGGSPGSLHLLRPSGRTDVIPPPPSAPVRRLRVSARGLLAAVTEAGRLLVFRSEAEGWREVSARVTHAEWSPNGTKLLFQESEFDLWVANIEEERSVLKTFQPELLVRLSTPVRGPQWFPDSQHVLFVEHDIIRLADIDPRGGHRIEDLTTTDRGGTTLAVGGDGAELLFAARRENRDVIVRAFLRTPADR